VANRYEVYAGNDLVLEVEDSPGPLISTSAPPPPPGTEPPPHPFLTATAYVATEEHRLRELLNQSTSTADYVQRLESEGYRVVQVS
jgi:hypothetical protein